MAGVKSITDRIIRDARDKAEQIIQNAEREADDIRKRAADGAERAKAERLERAGQEAKRAHERRVMAASMEGKKMVLDTKQHMLDEAFSLALADVLELDLPEYEAMLLDLIALAGTSGELMLCQRDRERIQMKQFLAKASERLKACGIAKPELTLSDRVLSAQGGFVLKRGDVELNYTVEALLKQKRESLEQELAVVLFS